MPTDAEREYYRMGFLDGLESGLKDKVEAKKTLGYSREYRKSRKPKRKLSAWNKFVKANSKKPRFRMRSGKLNLKKMAVAFRKTPASKKRKR